MKRRAFTIVELMVSITVTAMLILVLVSIASTASNAWLQGEAQAESFSGARGSINLLSRELKGAVVDLDLGLSVRTISGDANNFVIKFLSRAEPGKEETTATPVRKVAYQLAWASSGMIPTISAKANETHQNPILARMVSTELTDVFDVTKAANEGKWVVDWGSLGEDKVRAGENFVGGGEKTATTSCDVAAENVLGWKVTPFYWDPLTSKMILDEVGSTNTKYNRYLLSNEAPRAFQIKMAAISTRAAAQISGRFPDEWRDIRSLAGLFDQKQLPENSFGTLLRQNLAYFDATINLTSKTP